MKYDDASWHYEGDFPADLPPQAAATHIGMFLSWMLLNGLASEALRDDAAEEITALKVQALTGGEFLRQVLDEKLTDQAFDTTGNAFAVAYYQGEDDDSRYVDDYLQAFDITVDELYGIEDNWANHAKLSVLIDERFATWNAQGRPQYIL